MEKSEIGPGRAARAIAHLRIASMHGTPAFEPGQ